MAAVLAADPARLADEAAQLSLGGGRRVVRVRAAGDAHAKLLAEFLERTPCEALVVVEAGELSPFELASAYKIWQELNPTQRSQLDHAAEPKRRAALLNRGQRLKAPIARETRPAVG